MSSAAVEEEVPSPFAKRRGHFLRWEGVSMSVSENNAILQRISGEAPSGQVTAIMGPSGSGKTSLLNVLTGRMSSTGRSKQQRVVEKTVSLDGTLVDPAKDLSVRQRMAFVAQDDSLPVTATPREAIYFSARLRLPATTSPAVLQELTNTMLSELHLTGCADTIVGGALLKGISGGERKRTSVGVELVTRPAVVMADEPTSGLDSFNALELCNVLHKVAAAGSAVLLTIHQPSSDIFKALDRLILLNKGQVMYQGSASDVVDFFGNRNYPCPEHHNPADWIMTIAQQYSLEQLKQDGFFADNSAENGKDNNNNDNENDNEDDTTVHSTGGLVPEEKDRVGFATQVNVLLIREVQSLKRNKNTLKARSGMTLLISTLGGIIFYQVAENENEFTSFINVQSTFGALLVSLLANVFSTALPSLVSFPEERPVFLREYSTNHYSVTSYFVSRFTMELLITALQVTFSSMLTYFLVGFSAPFGPFWACLYTIAMTSTALGVLLGCSVKDPRVAMEFLPLIFMPQILFAGFFVPPDLIPNWLSWLVYVFPLTYATRIVVANEFEGNCQGLDPNYCQTVIDNVEADPDNLWWYWLVLVCQCVFCRLLALFILRQKASSFY